MIVRAAHEHYFVMFIEKKIFCIIKISSSMSFEASWGCGGWDGGWGGCKQGWKIFLNYTGRVAADTIRTECIREVLAL